MCKLFYDDYGLRTGAVVGTAVTFFAILIGVCVYFGIKADNDFAASCKAKGGHVKTATSSGYGITSNGKPGVVVTSTSYCLSKDGRILDVE